MENSDSGQVLTAPSRSAFLRNLLLFLLVFLPCVWFFSSGHINQTSRYDAIFAWFENSDEDAHTFRIDRYLDEGKVLNTTDWSEYDGHYYSNKSPGTTLFGTALLLPVYPIERMIAADGDSVSPRAQIFNAWYINFFLGVLPVSLSIFPLLGIFAALGMARVKAAFCALGTILCTAVFPYATTLLAHSTVAACLVFALYFALSGRRWHDVCAGAWCGVAVLMDYSAGLILLPAVAILAVCRRKSLLPFILGGLPFALMYAGYNAMCFGSCFAVAAQYINPVYQTGGMLNMPRAALFAELLIGSKRGILLMMPFFLFAFPGVIAMVRRGGMHRAIAILCGASALLLLLLNASFNGWHGGATTIARYMIPAFPAWAILAFHAPLRTSKTRVLFLLALLLSAFNMFAIAMYTPMTTEPDTSPLYRTTYSHLFDTVPPAILRTPPGNLVFRDDFQKWQAAGNFTLGSILGMDYAVSRILLLVLFGALFVVFLCNTRDAWRNWLGLDTWHFPKPDAFAVLAFVVCLLLCIAPRLIPWGMRESAVAFTETEPGLHPPYSAFGIACGRFVFTILAMLTKNVFTMALIKTVSSLAITCCCLRYAAKRLHVNPHAVLLIALASPYVMLAHRALDPAALLLPAGAVCLALVCRFRSVLKRIAYLVPVAVIVSLAVIITALCISRNVRDAWLMPFETACAYGVGDWFFRGMETTEPDVALMLSVAGYLSIVVVAVLTVIGLIVRRRQSPLLLCMLSVAAIGPVVFGVHPFSVMFCLPAFACFAAAGIGSIGGLVRRFGGSAIALQASKALFAFYIIFFMLVWITLHGAIEKGNGVEDGWFGTSLSHQCEIVQQARDAMIRKGIPQNEVKFSSAKKDADLLRAFVSLYRMDAACFPYHLRKEDISPEEHRPALLLRRDNEVTHDGSLKILLFYNGKK